MRTKHINFWLIGIVGALLSSALLVGCGDDETEVETPTGEVEIEQE